ncbi:MAG TPA: Na/Pi symporter [Paenalcaligenes sp.]|nr:Na/Pi symporter [Paenalcaligenes sp.]
MEVAFRILGGLGLFLVGMSLLTDGLTHFAGDSLRRSLLRFTGSPFKAFASGALLTLVVQSSTATTVTLIGFVSAGLITFAQSLGVVMGASLGTTGTGWIVSTLGLKVQLGLYTLPLIGFGALLRLLAKGRWRHLGTALAGFGMLFVGIDTMQEGMRGMGEQFTLPELAAGDWLARFIALGIGVLLTVIMQSSTATVATTLTALDAGALNFEMAAIVVIGAAIGTTMTGVLAALGGSLYAKRTALAHVLFNLSSGLIAILLLPVLLALLGLAQTHLGLQAGGVSLAAFHTLFIAVGVAVFLPQAHRCARQIERLLPERSDSPTRMLDQSQWQVPTLALASSHQALRATATHLLQALAAVYVKKPGEAPLPRQLPPKALPATAIALEQLQTYLSHIPFEEEDNKLAEHRLYQMHVLDHLLRLQGRAEQLPSLLNTEGTAELQGARQRFATMLSDLLPVLADSDDLTSIDVDQLAKQSEDIAALRQHARQRVMQHSEPNQRDPGHALQILDSMLWLDRTAHHVWRICHYLQADEAAQFTSDSTVDTHVVAEP